MWLNLINQNKKPDTMRISLRVIAGICIIIIMILSDNNVFAQGGPPPPPTGGHGQTTNLPPEGGTAPIGNGIAFLISLGLGYGIATVFKRKNLIGEEDLDEETV
jgi:hypothetical protein